MMDQEEYIRKISLEPGQELNWATAEYKSEAQPSKLMCPSLTRIVK